MASKIAKSGLSFNDLNLAYSRKGVDGLRSLLGEKEKFGKPRVTTRKKVSLQLAEFLSPQQHVLSKENCPPSVQQTVITLPPEKLALFQRRLQEGYDLPDSEYDAWVAFQEAALQ